MNVRLEPDARSPANCTEGILQPKLNSFYLINVRDIEFKRGSGEFRGRRVTIIRNIPQLLDKPVISLCCLFHHPRKPEFGTFKFLDLSEIPQVCPVERHSERFVTLPNQRADHAIAKGDSFIP